jgi:hypothetical protein
MQPSSIVNSLLARVLLGWALGILVVAGAMSSALRASAQAPPPNAAVRGEVFVVLASEADGVIDPSLADIPALRQPPFNTFRSMSVLARSTAQISLERPMEVALPNGRHLRIALERPLSDGRYRVRISINTPGQADYLSLLEVLASPGDPFFVAGQNWLGGTLVIGVRIGQRPAAR